MKFFSCLLFALALPLAAGPEKPEAVENRYENRLDPDINNDCKVSSLEVKAWVPKAAQFYAEFAAKMPRHGFIKFCAGFDKKPADGKLDAEEVKSLHDYCQILANYHNDQIIKMDLNRNGKIDEGTESNSFRNKYRNLIPGDGLSPIKGSDLELYKNRRLDDIYD
ncbi:MAG: hypothetical protein RL095_4107 [Verrucomicrobiota bacterium]|jgi:hypothetical protein